MAKTEWEVRAWTWTGNEYVPVLRRFKKEIDAEKEYRSMRVSNDTPQIDISRVEINRFGCVERCELMGRKD